MTKKEIMEAWADMPDDSEVIIDTFEAYEQVAEVLFEGNEIILR